jgi:hypothetical protein
MGVAALGFMRHKMARLAFSGACLYAARRYYRNWGATKEECRMTLPGDELVKAPSVQTTEAVSIDATVDEVWPWVVQIGQDRGGLYSLQALQNLVGLRSHNAERIHPEWQQLNAGDVVRLAPAGWMGLRDGIVLQVVDTVPRQRIVLRATPPQLPWDAVWSLHIVPHWEDRCRMVIRRRAAVRHPGEVLAVELTGPLTALLTRGILTGIKHRAETRPEPPATADPGSAGLGPAPGAPTAISPVAQ